MAKGICSQCGVELKKIRYIVPDWKGERAGFIRPPLCKPCWVKADAECRRIYETLAAINKAEGKE